MAIKKSKQKTSKRSKKTQKKRLTSNDKMEQACTKVNELLIKEDLTYFESYAVLEAVKMNMHAESLED